MKLDKELVKKEESFMALADRLEHSMTNSFNKFRVEIENTNQRSALMLEEM